MGNGGVGRTDVGSMPKEYQGERKTGEDDAGEFCAQSGMGKRAGGPKMHAHRE